jgi:hypothetical protein
MMNIKGVGRRRSDLLEVLSQNFPGKTEENHDEYQSG